MDIKTIPVGANATNCYVVYDRATCEASVIDPGGEAEKILGFLRENDFRVKNIFLTHGHYDHILGVQQVKEATGARIVVHRADAVCLSDSHAALYNSIMREPFRMSRPDILLKGGEKTLVGGAEMLFVHTPGHSPGSMCLFIGNVLFSGDTLFADGIGRSDFPTSDPAALRRSLARLMDLEKDYLVYPGHGGPTSLFYEKEHNRDFIEWAARGRRE
ncbi:MAG: MBL fold metallo-hydrolase [Oscillospiraceae bacterium]|jgi:glyoxylase-like metal-dependent hydrolase (beta-lactamase superfamily II)|nr:MBL fold metallo-hydrolase [Oscillospiraceae bacterium]